MILVSVDVLWKGDSIWLADINDLFDCYLSKYRLVFFEGLFTAFRGSITLNDSNLWGCRWDVWMLGACFRKLSLLTALILFGSNSITKDLLDSCLLFWVVRNYSSLRSSMMAFTVLLRISLGRSSSLFSSFMLNYSGTRLIFLFSRFRFLN